MYSYGTPNGNQYQVETLDQLQEAVKKLVFSTKVKEAYSDETVDALSPLIWRYKDMKYDAVSEELAIPMIAEAFFYTPKDILVVSRNNDASKDLFARFDQYKEHASKSKLTPYPVINANNGSIIRFISGKSNGNQVRGLSPRQIIVVV